MKSTSLEARQGLPSGCESKGNDFQYNIVTSDESWCITRGQNWFSHLNIFTLLLSEKDTQHTIFRCETYTKNFLGYRGFVEQEYMVNGTKLFFENYMKNQIEASNQSLS